MGIMEKIQESPATDGAPEISVPFHLPDISDLERAMVNEVLHSGWLTTGARAREFELAFGAAVAAPHAIGLSSCTAALHLAMDAVGVGPGDDVLLPAMTFASTASAVVHHGARPTFVDIDAADHTIDPTALERLCTVATKAVIAVDFAGQPARMAPILDFARARNLAVVEDAAHAFPASYRGQPVGSLADITCFSFYATKTLTTGEGGMATTARDDFAQRMRLMSNHGISRNAHDRLAHSNSWYYEILEPGWKYNMPDLAAALGHAQLSRSEEIASRRRAIASTYQAAFADHPAIALVEERPECSHAWHLFVIKLRPDALAIDRDRAIEELRVRGIGTSVHFIPLNLHQYYRDHHGSQASDCPVAVDCYDRSISLPIFPGMTDEQVDAVVNAVEDICRKFRR